MYREKFAITAEGQIYQREGHSWRLLGRIVSMLREDSLVGQEIRDWWYARLAADEPGENIVVGGTSQTFFMPSREGRRDLGVAEPASTGELCIRCESMKSTPTFVPVPELNIQRQGEIGNERPRPALRAIE